MAREKSSHEGSDSAFINAGGRCFRSVDSSSEGYPKFIAIDEEAQHQIMHHCCFGDSPPYIFFLLNGDIELYRNRFFFV
jgi:hypothetical protein